jgi:16S rRNA (cytosine1402-N4)-methyltransferase
VQENFKYMRRFLRLQGLSEVDGILADLGVSSYQFDTPERGFSLRFEGPLDMRMDNRMEKTAADVIATYNEQQLHHLFEQYGEVRNAKQLAKHIADNRRGAQVKTIGSFKALIGPVVRGNPNKYLAQVFQALRIEVNDELGVLKDFLVQSAQSLKQGGRLSIISFHSLEDRIIKQYIKRGVWNENEEAKPLLKAVYAKPIEPTEEELKQNPRSRSAKLRVAEKI